MTPALPLRRRVAESVLFVALLGASSLHCGDGATTTDAGTPRDAGRADVPTADARVTDAAVDVAAVDVPAADVHADAGTDAPRADVAVTDAPVVDAAHDAGAPVDAGPPGALRFDAPEEWTRLGTSFRVADDITGDGIRDAVLVDTFSPVGTVQITFAVAQPSGDFTPGTAIGVPGYSASLGYGDFDGDHHTDVLVRVQSASTPNSYILRGRGDGTFFPMETLPFSAGVIADFDHDGRADLLEASSFGMPTVHLRQASGAFVSVATTISLNTSALAVGDFDGDGTPDLAAETTVYRGLGGGHFGPAVRGTCDVCANPTRVLAARMDGDARDDLVLATSTQVVVLTGHADGSLQRAAAYAVPRPVQLAAADLDADGHTDLAVIGEPTGTTSDDLLALFFGDGTGSLPELRNYQNTRWNSIVPVLTDADRDGRMDVVLEGRFVAYGRGSRRLRAPELSVFTPGPSGASGAITRLDGPGTADLLVPGSAAAIARWHFQGDRGLGAMTSCAGPGSGPYRGIADLTNDGHPDAFTFAGGALSVWLGSGGCTFGAEHRSAITAYSTAFVLADGDGLLDLVGTTTGGLGVALATAPGDFGAMVVSPFTGDADYIVAGDWNRDHFVDALVVDNSAHTMTVFIGDAARHLTRGASFGGGSSGENWYPKAADADGDGDLDVVYVDNTASQLAILRNDGAGTFTREMLAAIDGVAEISVADLDRDGRLEVISGDNQLAISVFRVDPHGATRLMHLQLPRGQFPYDVDGDGHLDLVYFDQYSGSAVVAVTNNRTLDVP